MKRPPPPRPPGGPPKVQKPTVDTEGKIKPPAKPPGRSPPPKPVAPPPTGVQVPDRPVVPPPPKKPPVKKPSSPPPPAATKPTNAAPPSSPPPPKQSPPKPSSPPPPSKVSSKKVPPPPGPPPASATSPTKQKPPPPGPPPSSLTSASRKPPPAGPPPQRSTSKRPPPAGAPPPTGGSPSKRPPPAGAPPGPNDSPTKRSPPPGSPTRAPPPGSPTRAPPLGSPSRRPPPPGAPPSGTSARAPPPGSPVRPPPPGQPPGGAQSPLGGARRPLPPGGRPHPAGGPAPVGVFIPGVDPNPEDEKGEDVVPAEVPEEDDEEGAAVEGVPPPPDLLPPPPPEAPPPPPEELVPPPPPPDEEEGAQDTGQFENIQKLIPGRLNIIVHEAKAIGKRDAQSAVSSTKIDPYIKLTLGRSRKAESQKSKPLNKSGKNVNFKDQHFRFNLYDPKALAQKGDLVLLLQIWDNNILSDTLLGQVEVPLNQILLYFKSSDWYYLKVPTKAANLEAGEVRVSMHFQPSRKGGLVFKCVEGRKLKNVEMFGKQDPYCKFELGAVKKKTKTVKKGGTDPSFGGEEVEFWLDGKAWANHIHFSCWDEDIGSDDLIGKNSIDVLQFVSKATSYEEFILESLLPEEEFVLPIAQKNGKKSGDVVFLVQFFPCGELTITSLQGRNLVEKDRFGRQDPFIEYTTMGSIVNHKRKTKVDSDGGSDPVWNDEVKFAIMDHHEMVMEVYDHDRFGSNDLIGGASFSLLEVFKKGTMDTWIPLKHRDSWGSVSACGEVHVILDYTGPRGVSYPLRKPDVIGFDDSERVDRKKNLKEDQARSEKQKMIQEAKRFGLMVEDQDNDQEQSKTALRKADINEFKRSDEFTDEEITDSFSFLDLNKNGFIGAAEIRHILICMGELITDSEVDEMIRMVDTDGDGQVSFEEFYALITDPDPSRPDFDPRLIVDVLQQTNEEKERQNAEKRAQEVRKKNEKVGLMNKFTRDNGMKFSSLKRCFQKFLAQDVQRVGVVNFDAFCDVMEVEPTGEYQRLFELLLVPNRSDHVVDYREMLLGLNNFTGASTKNRVKFAFEMFDDDRNGFITESELVNILKANHLVSDESAVLKKAQTIMRQADNDADNKMDLAEFQVIATKFPNILFPSIHA